MTAKTYFVQLKIFLGPTNWPNKMQKPTGSGHNFDDFKQFGRSRRSIPPTIGHIRGQRPSIFELDTISANFALFGGNERQTNFSDVFGASNGFVCLVEGIRNIYFSISILGLFPSHSDAPRMVITNGMVDLCGFYLIF